MSSFVKVNCEFNPRYSKSDSSQAISRKVDSDRVDLIFKKLIRVILRHSKTRLEPESNGVNDSVFHNLFSQESMTQFFTFLQCFSIRVEHSY